MENQKYIRTDIIYCHLGDLNLWPEAACTARNYGLHKWSPKSDADERTDRHRDGRTDGDISLTGTHWGPLDPNAGINASRRWNPTLEINTNTKLSKGPQTTGRTDRYPCGLSPHALCTITGRANDLQKATWNTRQRDREIDRQRDGYTDGRSHK